MNFLMEVEPRTRYREDIITFFGKLTLLPFPPFFCVKILLCVRNDVYNKESNIEPSTRNDEPNKLIEMTGIATL